MGRQNQLAQRRSPPNPPPAQVPRQELLKARARRRRSGHRRSTPGRETTSALEQVDDGVGTARALHGLPATARHGVPLIGHRTERLDRDRRAKAPAAMYASRTFSAKGRLVTSVPRAEYEFGHVPPAKVIGHSTAWAGRTATVVAGIEAGRLDAGAVALVVADAARVSAPSGSDRTGDTRRATTTRVATMTTALTTRDTSKTVKRDLCDEVRRSGCQPGPTAASAGVLWAASQAPTAASAGVQTAPSQLPPRARSGSCRTGRRVVTSYHPRRRRPLG